MYRGLNRRNTGWIIAILLVSSSSCSLLFEQGTAGDSEVVDAARPDDAALRDGNGAMILAVNRRVSADSEQFAILDTVVAEDLVLDINEKGAEPVQPNCVALEFRAVDIPQRAEILEASIVFFSQEQRAEAITVQVLLDQAVPVTPLSIASNDIRNRNLDLPVSWTPGTWLAGASGAAQTTPSLVEQVQANLCRSAWTSGQSLVFVIQPGADAGRRSAYSLEGSLAKIQDDSFAPLLHIRYRNGGSNCP